jgi:hypothetical protein
MTFIPYPVMPVIMLVEKEKATQAVKATPHIN